MKKPLSKLKNVDLRKEWVHENEFTNWLSSREYFKWLYEKTILFQKLFGKYIREFKK